MRDANRLIGVDRLSVGQQAALRREAGKCLRDADAQALQAFYTALPRGVPTWDHEQYYAVMCMLCLWKSEDRVNPRPFAECLGIMRKTDSADGRFRALLDTPWQYDEGYLISKLTRFARQIRSYELRLYPDFERLLDDLLKWNAPKRSVQRRWMEQYIGIREEPSEANEQESTSINSDKEE